jgi:hypothetical protein
MRMREGQEAMVLVRAELCERLASLQRLSARLSGRDLTRSIDSIRMLASAYGLTTVARLAEAFERAIVEVPPKGYPELYLDRLYDAIGCERSDDEASQAMIASVAIRYSA